MAVIESKVPVPTPAVVGSNIDNVQVTTGQGAVQRQVTVQGDPENPNARVAVTNGLPTPGAFGGVARLAPHNLDTGRVLLGGAYSVAVAGTVQVALFMLSNITTKTQKVSATDGLDAVVFEEMPLEPGQVLPMKLEGAAWASGVKWKVKTAGTVVGQIVGDQ